MDPALQQLKDIHLPPAISNWPLAPGWFIILILILTGLYFLYRRYRKRRIIRFAFAKLKRLREIEADNPDEINIAAELSTLIRRTALYYFPREDIAGLTGHEWINFLNRSGQTTEFTKVGLLLIDAPYKKDLTSDIAPLLNLTHDWLAAIAKKKEMPVEK